VKVIDIGAINLMIVFVEQETGMDLNALFVQLTLIGMENHVFHVMVEEFGTL
jgi:hypothetical protein